MNSHSPDRPWPAAALCRTPLTLLAFTMLVVSALLAWQGGEELVERIVVSKQAPIPDFNDSPDLYLYIETDDASYRTSTHRNTRVGNGVCWVMPRPIKISSIRGIELWDEDLLRSDLLDCVTDIAGLQARGELYRFELVVGDRPEKFAATVAMAASGGYCLLIVARIIYDQTV